MAIVARAKYTHARERSRRRDAKGAPKIRDQWWLDMARKAWWGYQSIRAPFASRLLEISRARVYFVRPTVAIAKIRDYSQSSIIRENLGVITV